MDISFPWRFDAARCSRRGTSQVTYVTLVPQRERDAASQGHTSGFPTRAMLHSWKLAPAAHHVLLSIVVVTSPAPDVWLSILTDYTYDSELDIADGVPLAFRRSVSFPRGTRVTYVTWDVHNRIILKLFCNNDCYSRSFSVNYGSVY